MNVEPLSRWLGVPEAGVWILTGVAAVLGLAAAKRWFAVRRHPGAEALRAWRSVGTWWVLFAGLVLALLSGRIGVLLMTATLSALLLAEMLRIVERGRDLFVLLAGAGALLYVWGWFDWRLVFTRALPVVIAAIVAWEVLSRTRLVRRGLSGPPVAHYPILIALIGPAYVYAVTALPAPGPLAGSEMGWFLLLVLLTELNDMAQSWWGRAIGSRPLAPVLSPRKTWEGLVGGLVTTCAAALILSPNLTGWGRVQPPGLEVAPPLWIWSLGVGLLIALVGVAGDLAASALKRRAGLKDAGTLLPGHGGVLDRFDSLVATAPVFYLVTYALWFSRP